MSKSVLLCDDEVHILRAAEFKFQRAGFDVRTAADGLEGWEQILARRPDLLITDWQMPRLDGFGLVQRIRAEESLSDLPIIMLTAKGFEVSHEELRAHWGVRAVLAKPFSPRELLLRAEELMAAAAEPAAPVTTAGS